MRLAVLAVATLVGAGAPYPAQHEGRGTEPTAGRGTFAGTPFVPRSALVRYELGLSCCPSKTVGEVVLYLFERPGVGCAGLAAARSRRFFTYSVETDGRRLPVGRAVPGSLFQQASFNVVGLTSGFQNGAALVPTRVDTAAGGVWHGRVAVAPQTLDGRRYALTATFAARWCGTKGPGG